MKAYIAALPEEAKAQARDTKASRQKEVREVAKVRAKIELEEEKAKRRADADKAAARRKRLGMPG